jgi:hypothetical protein
VIIQWTELLTMILAAGVAGYYLHVGLSRRRDREEQNLQNAVRKVEESSPAIMRYEIQREIERIEARLTELKARQKEWTEKA